MCLVQFTQFISNPCCHETKQRFRMGEIAIRYVIKTNSVFFKFHQHVVLCTTGRFYTILTEPHINKTTSELRVRQNNQQALHQSRWCFIPNYIQELLLVPWVDFTLFRSNCVSWMQQPVVLKWEKITTIELHRSQWRFIQNYTHTWFLYHGWILHNLIQPHLTIKTTSGFRVTKITTR